MSTLGSIRRLGAVAVLAVALSVHAGSTAFRYQGRLGKGTNQVSGTFDFSFTLFSDPLVGSVLAGPVTNNAVNVAAGMFVTMLDFGPNVFTGADCWLEIAVRTNGGSSFIILTPRQAVTPVPKALFSGTAAVYSGPVSASQLTGTIPLSLLPAGLITNGASSVTLAGVFAGSGAGLTNLNAMSFGNGTAAASILLPNASLGPIPVDLRDTPIGVSRSAANTSGTFRRQVNLATNCHDLQLVYENNYRNNNNTIVPNTNPIAFKAALEVNGVIYPVFFAGSRTNMIGPGGTSISDPIGVSVNRTDAVYVRTFFLLPPGGYLPTGITYLGAGWGVGNDTVTYGADLCDSGTLNSVTSVTSWGCRAVLGVPTRHWVGVGLIGDSIMDGAGDNNLPTATEWAQPVGFCERALAAANIGYTKIACGGDTAAAFATNASYRITALAGANGYVINYGINDVNSGFSLSTLKRNALAIWNYLGSRGLPVFQTTLSPDTSSTDYWISTTNQRPRLYETNRVAFNSWLRDPSAAGAVAMAGGNLTDVFDLSPFCETNGVWMVSNAPLYTGVATDTGTNYLTDTNQTSIPVHTLDWTSVIQITAGTGSGQVQIIKANSPANKYTVSTWTVQPDVTSQYAIWVIPTFDGLHPDWAETLQLAAGVNVNQIITNALATASLPVASIASGVDGLVLFGGLSGLGSTNGSNLLAPTPVTVSTGSPWLWTNNFGVNIQVAISGGAVSGIDVNGAPFYPVAATTYLVPLQPGSYLGISNSAPPALYWRAF